MEGFTMISDIVCGDFDSITKQTLEHYRSRGCRIVNTPDQNHTDFEKALQLLASHPDLRSVHSVCILSTSSGHLDHTLSNLSILLRAERYLGKIPVYMYSYEDVSFVLHDTSQKWVSIDVSSEFANDRCSVIPLVGQSIVYTQGLFWELTGQELRFDKFISSSNRIIDPFRLNIKISGSPVLLTVGHKLGNQ